RCQNWRLPLLGVVLALSCSGCGGFRPYRAMAKTASSEESVFAQVDDKRVKASLREALGASDPGGAIHVTPYVFMGHAYLVGSVSSPAEAAQLTAAAQGVEGIRSLETYLPQKSANESTTSDLTIKTEVKAALALAPDEVVNRVEIEVLGGHVVLLGVLK